MIRRRCGVEAAAEECVQAWLPDGYSQIFRLLCLALRASGLWLRYAALQNLIPSFPWIAPPRPPPWRYPKERKGSNFAIWQPWDQVTDMMVANSSNLIITVKPANQRTLMPRRGSFSRTSNMSHGSLLSKSSGQSAGTVGTGTKFNRKSFDLSFS